MKYTESAIQRQLIIWLAQQYPATRVNYNKNEGKKTALEGRLDKLMGLRKARPDLDLQLDVGNLTYILELELKKTDGALSKDQKIYHLNFFPTRNKSLSVAYGLIHAQEIITNWVKNVTDAKIVD